VLFAVGGDRLARVELAADQPRIKPVARDELGVGAGLDHPSAIEINISEIDQIPPAKLFCNRFKCSNTTYLQRDRCDGRCGRAIEIGDQQAGLPG
jgi:hypothetical protein